MSSVQEAVMVRYDSPKSFLQSGTNFIGTCPYTDFCPAERTADFQESVCSIGGSCLTHENFDKMIYEAFNGEGRSYSSGYVGFLGGNNSGYLFGRDDDSRMFTISLSDEPRIRILAQGRDLKTTLNELKQKGFEERLVQISGPLGAQNGA